MIQCSKKSLLCSNWSCVVRNRRWPSVWRERLEYVEQKGDPAVQVAWITPVDKVDRVHGVVTVIVSIVGPVPAAGPDPVHDMMWVVVQNSFPVPIPTPARC